MNRLEYEINRTYARMTASEIYHISQAAHTAIAFARGRYYTDGPVCLQVTLPDHTTRSIIEAHYVGTYTSLKSHRTVNTSMGLY